MGKFFGDKGFTSMTAWGVIILALGQALVNSAGQVGFVTPEGVALFGKILTGAGTLFAGFGARRAIGRSNPNVVTPE